MPSKTEQAERMRASLTNVTPTPETLEVIEKVREAGKQLGEVIIAGTKTSREQSLALTHLEETVMWAVKGLVLNQDDD